MAAVAGLIRGLDRFQAHFADYADQYVLLGGSAATLTMDAAGLAFRATKDLDIKPARDWIWRKDLKRAPASIQRRCESTSTM